MPSSNDESRKEAFTLWELFGPRAYDAVKRRIALHIDSGQLDDAMFWLEVQTHLYGFGGPPEE